ncbi:uncharacterized protein [Fopius arisanus]|uniref:ATP-dependent DNA helicase n=1 Tax=Fopius arisanus TaxID=64838 RepID=A0A9R1TQB3_9HYME|nr:PREDICTED: uncharacterized protein LOC105272883 [Fopius arisanus]
MYETIKPSNVCSALHYLINSPLYKKNGITVDKNFFDKYDKNDEFLLDFTVDGDICYEKNLEDKPNKDNEKLSESDDDLEEGDSPYEESDDEEYALCTFQDEVLIIDEDLEVSIETCIMAPCQNNYPVPWHLINDLDELCFPTIFAGEIFDPNKKLNTYGQRAKLLARNNDRRSSQPTRILFMAKRKLEERVISAVNVCVRKLPQNNEITAGQVRSKSYISDMITQDEGYSFLRNVRPSPAFWEAKKKNPRAMIRQLGTPTLFITLSVSETNDPELIQFLYGLKNDNNQISLCKAATLDNAVKNQLVIDDPVSVGRYLDHRFKEVIKLLKNPDCPFQKNFVVDYFTRKEFQGRGTVHTHTLLWCNDAPKYNPDDDNSIPHVVNFIDALISCQWDPTNPFIMFQKHRHTLTCNKERKNIKKCRFNYPQYVMKSTQILKPLDLDEKEGNEKENLLRINDLMQVYSKNTTIIDFAEMLGALNLTEQQYLNAIRSTLDKDKLFIKRQTCDVTINNYNTTILNILEANMDIQFVLDPYACAQYIINYISKIDVGMSRLLREAVKDLKHGNRPLRKKLRRYGNIFINGNIMSAQEAVYHVLELPLCESSRSVIFINTSPKNQRVRIFKSQKHLVSLDEDSIDIYTQNILEKYEQRILTLENLCWADFAACNVIKSKINEERDDDHNGDDDNIDNLNSSSEEDNDDCNDETGGNAYTANSREKVTMERLKRKKVKIIRYVRYTIQRDEQNYYREQVLLFYPWRNEITDIENVDCKMIYQQYLETIEQNRKKYSIIGDEVIDEAIENAMEDNQKKHDEEDLKLKKMKLEKYQEIDIFGQAGIDDNNKKFKIRFTKPETGSQEQIYEMLDSLNTLQREITMHVFKCFKINQLPLRIFLSGSAGVGKTRVINSIYRLLTSYFDAMPGQKNELPHILLCAPSGKAAHLIGGVTLHTAFALPITEFGGQMPQLSADIANSIRCKLVNLKLLIIDEVSMVGSNTLSRVDSWLREILGKNRSFGGISVILIGDLHQLPPVMYKAIYNAPTWRSLNALSDAILWEEFQFFELTEVMRQKNDKIFVNALNNLASGTMTADDIALIRTREVLPD